MEGERLGVWKGSGRCLEGVWKISGGCLDGVWKVSGRYLEGVWKVSGRFLEGVWKVYILWDPNFSANQILSTPKFFQDTKFFMTKNVSKLFVCIEFIAATRALGGIVFWSICMDYQELAYIFCKSN